jgi:hypothetical protein
MREGLSKQSSNRLKLLWSRAMVVSIEEKSRHRTVAGEDQGDERKRTTDEVSKSIRRRRNWGALRTPGQAQGERVYCLGGARHKGGVTLI